MSFLLVAGFFVGCGSPQDQGPPVGGGGSADLGNHIQHVDQAAPVDLARMCVGNCNYDSDCQNSCPIVSGGVSCCDTTTATCFSSQSQVCPAPADMSGGGPY